MQSTTMRNTYTAKRSAKLSGKGKRQTQVKLTKHWRAPTELYSPITKLTNPICAWSPRMKAALVG